METHKDTLPVSGEAGGKKKKDTSNKSYNKLNHVSVKQLGQMIRKKKSVTSFANIPSSS